MNLLKRWFVGHLQALLAQEHAQCLAAANVRTPRSNSTSMNCTGHCSLLSLVTDYCVIWLSLRVEWRLKTGTNGACELIGPRLIWDFQKSTISVCLLWILESSCFWQDYVFLYKLGNTCERNVNSVILQVLRICRLFFRWMMCMTCVLY